MSLEEKRIREIAREEALKCIIEEDHRKAKESLEFMNKIRHPKENLEAGHRVT